MTTPIQEINAHLGACVIQIGAVQDDIIAGHIVEAAGLAKILATAEIAGDYGDPVDDLVDAIHDAITNGEGEVLKAYVASALKKAGLRVVRVR